MQISFAKSGKNTEYCNPSKLSRLKSKSAVRIGKSLITKRNPNEIHEREPTGGFCSVFGNCIARRAMITATNYSVKKKHSSLLARDAFQKKCDGHSAIAGPTTRAPLKIEDSTQIAFGGKSGFPPSAPETLAVSAHQTHSNSRKKCDEDQLQTLITPRSMQRREQKMPKSSTPFASKSLPRCRL